MILDEIVLKTKDRVEELKSKTSLNYLKELLRYVDIKKRSFYNALNKEEISFICEVKKASPSKGIISEEFDYVNIAKEYEKAGADAISVLTEPYFFKGDNKYLEEITQNVELPVLRKDFVIDEYQIYESKFIGANAILLICSILSENQLKEYLDIADTLGLDVLVEAHDEDEIVSAIKSGAKIIGVNNRNLKDFTVDINNSINLRKFIPEDILYVSESGIKTRKDIITLENDNVNGVLIGETLMMSTDKKKEINNLRGIDE